MSPSQFRDAAILRRRVSPAHKVELCEEMASARLLQKPSPAHPRAECGEGGGGGAASSWSIPHICIPIVRSGLKLTQGSGKKMAEVVSLEVVRFARQVGVERMVFLTGTMPGNDRVKDQVEFQRRYHSLMANMMPEIFTGGINIQERHQDKTLHFHGIEVVDFDARTGFDFDAFDKAQAAWKAGGDTEEFRYWRRVYAQSACPQLRALWALLKVRFPDFGFGTRFELLPVRTNAEAIGRYLGKYVVKGYDCRLPEDRGKHLVRFWGFARMGRVASAQFAWAKGRAAIWREGVGAFAEHYGLVWASLRQIGGARWAYHLGAEIMARGIAVWKGGEDYVKSSEQAEKVAGFAGLSCGVVAG